MKILRKRILAVTMSLIMVISCFAGMTFTVGAETIDDYEYKVLDDGTVSITKYKGNDTDVEIPSVIDGKKVSSIGSESFRGVKSLATINIPNSVTKIGDYAFAECIRLTKITIPNSVKEIGKYAFEGCVSIENMSIPNGVTEIAKGLFSGCRKLVNILMQNSIVEIGESAFNGCTMLACVNIPDGVKKIQYSTFYGCESLTSVAIPNSVTEIEDMAFFECSGLESINIPNSVKKIGSMAFFHCGRSYKFSVILPESVEVIFNDAFLSTRLKHLIILNREMKIIGTNMGNMHAICSVIGYPNSSAEDYMIEHGYEDGFVDINSCIYTNNNLKNEKEATCTEKGYKNGIKCSVCGEIIKEPEEIPALGHKEEIIKGKPATCTEDGLTDGVKCSVCGEVIKEQEKIPAFGGHNFSKGLCLNCGAIDPDYKLVLSEQIKIDNDTKTAVFSLPKTSGMKVSEFKKQFDGEISVDIDDNSLVANGTKFKFGSNEFTVIVKGDVQADGKITASDARMVLRIAARLESVDANAFGAADINGDGKVSPGEARKVLRFVARLENTIE